MAERRYTASGDVTLVVDREKGSLDIEVDMDLLLSRLRRDYIGDHIWNELPDARLDLDFVDRVVPNLSTTLKESST